ncbi:MAG: DNA replication/repair protein RecF [Verrucomicrobiota bacterium]|nr:DNA replication/repair protein RecF [Limisphaera sp.]MDW8380498.1 DNA replication/repair protein RecF [Verrucomicrobiota bacterium]
MHLTALRLRDFRNYARLDASFAPGLHLFLGRNAQGKTNLLEAIYLLATLRSFRGAGHADLVRFGQSAYQVAAQIVSDVPHEVRIYWSSQQRQLLLDGQPIRRLVDYLGTFRVTIFCSEDLNLIKGSARFRRRFLDLVLSQTQPDYLAWWQRYTRALRARNALLKQTLLDLTALEAFTTEMVTAGRILSERRKQLVPRLGTLAQQAYDRLAKGREAVLFRYVSTSTGDLNVDLQKLRLRELTRKTTLAGPHLDDLEILLNDQPAATFASEGQKRSLAIALKMAQAEYLAEVHGTPPVLLIDDVMGELDAERRAAFLPLLHRAYACRGQVFMTATEEGQLREIVPSPLCWRVEAGALHPIRSR